jgi:hypothetical protein
MADQTQRGERRPCPICPRLRLPHQYLCRWCWGELPLRARCALDRRDDYAPDRFNELARQVKRGTRPADVVITQ